MKRLLLFACTAFISVCGFAQPNQQASDISVTPSNGSVSISWTPGDGDGRIVAIKASTPSSFVPTNNITYNANSDLSSSTPVSDDTYIVYEGNGNSVTVNGLYAYEPYYVYIYEYSGAQGSEQYLTTITSGNYLSFHACDIPVGTPEVITVCSETQLGILIDNYVSPTGNSYTWYAEDNPNVIGETTDQIIDYSINDYLENQTSESQSVFYTITPSNGSCTGAPFTLEVIISPRIEVTIVNNTEELVSGAATDIQLSSPLQGVTFTWESNNYSVLGESDGSGNSINQTLVNTSGMTQFVSYKIQAQLGSCINMNETTSVAVFSAPAVPISVSDSLALVAIYNATGGPDWNYSNWLVTDVRNWEGVSVAGDRVRAINLTYMGLTGAIPTDILELSELEALDVMGNNLTSIPDLSSLPVLEHLNIVYNRLTFESIISNLSLPNFDYNPQNFLPVAYDPDGDGFGNVNLMVNEPLNLSFSFGDEDNIYQWSRSASLGSPIDGETSNTLSIPEIQSSDEGYYFLIVTNSYVPNLELVGGYYVNIIDPVAVSDSVALVDFYNASGGPSWTNHQNWLVGYVDTWEGVTVTNGRVTGLHMNTNFTGSIPTSLQNLTALKNLDLTGFSGPLPAEIGNITSLEFLRLSGNFTGNIPASFGNLSNLQVLHLPYSQLTGTIPPELGNLSSLVELDLSFNQLSGAVPVELSNLSNLNYLRLTENELTSLPDLTGIPYLYQIELYNNRFGFDAIEENVEIINHLDPQKRLGVSEILSPEPGTPVTMTHTVGGVNNLYQWYRNNEAINGANTNTFTIPAYSPDDQGAYHLEVTNALIYGTLESEATVLLNGDIQNSTNGIGTLAWAFNVSASGGSSSEIDGLQSIVGPDGSFYSIGDFYGTVDMDPGAGVAQLTSDPINSANGYVVKYSPNGTFVWAKSFSLGEGEDNYVSSIAIDASNNVYVGGSSNGDYDGLLISYSPEGNHRWTRNFSNAQVTTLSAHANGNLLITHQTNSSMILRSVSTSNGNDVFVKIFNNESSEEDEYAIWGLSTDGAGNIYISGTLEGVSDFDPDGPEGNIGEEYKTTHFMASYTANGTLRWAKYLISTDFVSGMDLVMVDGGFVTQGYFEGSVDFDPGDGDATYTMSDPTAFIAKYNLDGEFEWVRFLESIPTVVGYSDLELSRLSVNNKDEVLVSGGFAGVIDLDPSPASYVIASNPTQYKIEGFLALYSSNGDFISGYALNSSEEAETYVSASFGQDGIYVTGQFGNGSIDVNPTEETTLLTSVGDDDNALFFKLLYGDGEPINLADSIALVQIYETTGGASWTNSSQWFTGPMKDWYGVTVKNGRVTKLDLSNNNLVGTLPSSIANLTALDTLSLSMNQLIAIPSEIGSLTQLKYLDFSENQISGAIPNAIYSLTSLRTLRLQNNQLTGTLSSSFGNLINLEKLWINNNLLTGTIPASFSNLVNLTHLFIQNNMFSGAIPQELGEDLSLQEFSIANNQFTSFPNITPFTGQSGDLSMNFLNFNSLAPNAENAGLILGPQKPFIIEDEHVEVEVGGSVSLSFDAGTGATYTWLKDNVQIPGQTTGTFSIAETTTDDDGVYHAIAIHPSLVGLELITREVAIEVMALKRDSLALVALYEATGGSNWTNRQGWLTANISTWAGVTVQDGRVTAVSLPNNNLTGAVPATLINVSAMKSLNLSGNNLTSIPDLTSMASLTTLNVSNNNLQFDVLLPNRNIQGFVYSNQKNIGSESNTTAPVGTNVELTVDAPGEENEYQWKRNGEIVPGATASSYTIVGVNRASMGDYVLEVTNPLLPDLTLVSSIQQVLATASIQGTLKATATIPATAGTITLFRVTDGPFEKFEPVNINEQGQFTLNNVVLDNYQLLGTANTELYPRAIPTYYKNTFLWEEADTLFLEDNVNNLEIVSQQEPSPVTASGVISGVLEEEVDDDEGRVKTKKKISDAGVSARRVEAAGRGKEEILTLVAYTVTDQNGEFILPNLEVGEYRLNIQYPGVPMDPNSFITIPIGTGLQSEVIVAATVVEGKIDVRKVIITGWLEEEPYSADVYPNPTSDFIHLKFLSTSVDRTIKLIDMQGQTLYQALAPEKEASVNVQSLQNGIFLLRIEENGQTKKVYKVAIE